MIRRWSGLVLFLVGLACAIFLTFRQDGNVSSLGILPEFIAHWVDRAGRLRNFPAYALLSLPALWAVASSPHRRLVGGALVVFAAVMEFLQRIVPTRWFDLGDIAWSWAGIGLAWAAIEFVDWIRRRKRES